ncbi:unnamed protein product [Phytophthora lilii]|uniref:Unnamed protein product n=1 Tax=Phytophthora lilii TaxID=2077276 RepID=A0A9W6TD19_9STRA|nr:unnamed protein product [Phytophthora lilii]
MMLTLLSILLLFEGNALTSLAGLQSLPALTTLEASRNAIEDIANLAGDKLESLHLIETLEAVQQLEQLTKVINLNLAGNPVTQVEDYRQSIILLAPTLTHLDGEQLTDEDRLAAVELKHRREAEAAEQAEANE